jgi:hypothetical protein
MGGYNGCRWAGIGGAGIGVTGWTRGGALGGLVTGRGAGNVGCAFGPGCEYGCDVRGFSEGYEYGDLLM